MAAAIHRERNGPPGPTSLDTRFVIEDTPFGLVPLVALARQAGIAVPLHEAGIVLFSALYGRDFRGENDLLPALDLEDLNPEDLRALVRDPRSHAAKIPAA
jgi:opine dehydrogenase